MACAAFLKLSDTRDSTSEVYALVKPKVLIIAMAVAAFIGFIVFVPSGQQGKPVAGTGLPAPEFTLTDIAGKSWSLAGLKGKVVVINFWATWCPPCRSEMPSLSNFFNKTMDKDDIVVLTILYNDSPDAASAYFKENGFQMPILLDPSSRVAGDYGLTGVPETFVIDKKGILLQHVIGPTEFDTPSSFGYFESLRAQAS
jgi:peroxiredoxin